MTADTSTGEVEVLGEEGRAEVRQMGAGSRCKLLIDSFRIGARQPGRIAQCRGRSVLPGVCDRDRGVARAPNNVQLVHWICNLHKGDCFPVEG